MTRSLATSRRGFMLAVFSGTLAVACGTPGDSDAGDRSAVGFPVTVTHKFGETTVEAAPRRIVSVGVHEQDFLYALGMHPVGVREWLDGGYDGAVWPWAEDEAGGTRATVLPEAEIDFEGVAALQPDLIIATYSGISESDYAILSKLAPVIAQSGDHADWAMPWREETRMIGAAVGKLEEAEELISSTEAVFEKARAQYPQLQAATCAIIGYFDGTFATYNSEDLGHRFLAELGLRVPAEIDAIAEGIYVNISPERTDLLELDVAVWWTGQKTEVEPMPLYQSLRLAREGRSVWLDDSDPTIESALSMQTPLSFAYLVENLTPLLAAAVDGNPST